jgi:transcriptional regulator with XRE-family HTH domain
MEAETRGAKPNRQLRRERDIRGWSQRRVADEIDTSVDTVSKWERGINTPDPHFREKLCVLFGKTALELDFISHEPVEIVSSSALSPDASSFYQDSTIRDKLDSAESIINLSWEAWFASRPKQAAREISRLLPDLNGMAYTLPLTIDRLRAKELGIRCHGLLGTIHQDALHYDSALFHYMQAHRFSEEINDTDLMTIYLCLMGDVLRCQKDQSRALSHMERARDLAASASNATRGHILQLLAYTYGDNGQEAAFERTIAEATDLLAFSGGGIDTSQKEFIPFQIYEIRGKINRDLGKTREAISYLDLAEKSLITTDSVTPRWQALLEISRAQTYCDAGDIALGIDLACKGFIMSYQCRSPHQMNRVRKLLRKLEDGPFRSHPRVQDLKNLVYETYMHMDVEDSSRNFPPMG